MEGDNTDSLPSQDKMLSGHFLQRSDSPQETGESAWSQDVCHREGIPPGSARPEKDVLYL